MNLQDLLDRIEGALGWDEEIDGILGKMIGMIPEDAIWDKDIWHTGGYGEYKFHYPLVFTDDITDATRLVEEALPGWVWGINGPDPELDGKCLASVWQTGEPPIDAEAATPALALCAALIRSKLAEAEK